MMLTTMPLGARTRPALRSSLRSRPVLLMAASLLGSLSLLTAELAAQGRGQGRDNARGAIGQQQAGRARDGGEARSRDRGGWDRRDDRDDRDGRHDRRDGDFRTDRRDDRDDRDGRNDRRDGDVRGNGARGGMIPPGHLPSPGECRVWFDGLPPGQQSAPTSCARAEAEAWRRGGRVVYGGDRQNGRYDERDDRRYPDDRRDRGDMRNPVLLPDVLGDVILGRRGRLPQE